MKYLCYDTAVNEEYTLVQLIRKYPVYQSLFANTDDEDIWDAAPYLFEVSDNYYEMRRDPLVKLNHCLLFETEEKIEDVCRFLQYYIYNFQNNQSDYFRIWDARVLLRQLPGWELALKKQFFEFFNCFYSENRNGNCLDIWEPGRFYRLNVKQVQYDKVLDTFEEPETAAQALTPPPAVSEVAGEAQPGAEDTSAGGAKRRRFFIE